MSRGKWVAAGMALAAVVAAGGYVLFFADRQTEVDVGDAVEDFRTRDPDPDAPVTPPPVTAPATRATAGEQAASVACATDDEPPVTEGVYVYSTEGGEQLQVPTSPSHDYDGESVLTVVALPGGYRTVWQPVQERRQELQLCMDGDGGLELRRLHDARRFLGVTTERTMECEPGSAHLPPRGVDRGEGSCAGDGTTFTWTTTVVGDEELTIDGQTVSTVHVRVEGELGGNSRGVVEEDLWYVRERFVQVRRESHIDAEGDTPLGAAAYEETVRMQLTSLAPRS